jgi:hypothetical protein
MARPETATSAKSKAGNSNTVVSGRRSSLRRTILARPAMAVTTKKRHKAQGARRANISKAFGVRFADSLRKTVGPPFAIRLPKP